jgi:transcriptional regulator GlxA family with amidase domain
MSKETARLTSSSHPRIRSLSAARPPRCSCASSLCAGGRPGADLMNQFRQKFTKKNFNCVFVIVTFEFDGHNIPCAGGRPGADLMNKFRQEFTKKNLTCNYDL